MDTIDALHQQRRDLELLTNLGTQLQRSWSRDDIKRALAYTAGHMFADQSGSLYLRRAEGVDMWAAAVWGDAPDDEQTLLPEMCPALHTLRACLEDDGTTTRLDLPLVAQGELLGLLRLRRRSGSTPQALEHWQQMAGLLAQQVAQVQANIQRRLRTIDHELLHADRHQRPLHLLLIGIDNFRRYNREHDTTTGDVLLHTVGTLLESQAPTRSFRLRSDVFVLLLPETTPDQAHQEAERLREQIGRIDRSHTGTPLVPVTASVGVVQAPDQRITAEELIASADDLLLKAKIAGRNQVQLA